jgi:hypothetical protein
MSNFGVPTFLALSLGLLSAPYLLAQNPFALDTYSPLPKAA